jgi:VanZ family protein
VPKYSLTIAAFSIGVAIVFLSVIPLSLPPNVLNTDKIAHFLAYSIFSTCLGLAFNLDWRLKRTRLIVILAVFSFGMVLELIQGYLILYRTFEVFDLLANSAGICAFVFSGKTIEKVVVKSGIFIN